MKLDSKELLEALGKVSGIVNDRQVVQSLRTFHFLPEDGVLKVAGTDSNTTLIESVDYIPTDKSDGSKLTISADKIMDVVRYAGDELEFIYTEESEGLVIETPTNKVTLFKYDTSMDDMGDIIDFELGKEEDFSDEVEVGELKVVLNSLSTVVDSATADPSFKTIFLNGEQAVVGDEATITTIDFITNEKYEFSLKIAKQVITLLNSLEEDSVVKMKKFGEGTRVLLRTDVDVMSFGLSDVFEPDLDVIVDFKPVASVLVAKEDLTRGIHLVKSTSEEDRITLNLGESNVRLTSYNQGEEAKDDVSVGKAKVSKEIDLGTLAPELLKLIGIVDSVGVVLAVDEVSSILQVREPTKKVVSAIVISVD